MRDFSTAPLNSNDPAWPFAGMGHFLSDEENLDDISEAEAKELEADNIALLYETPEPVPNDQDGMVVYLSRGFERKKAAFAEQYRQWQELRDQAKRELLIDFTENEGLLDDDWLIEDVLELEGLSILIGPPKGGKSAVTLDEACRVAMGMDSNGKYTNKAAVGYIMSEGREKANRRRVLAWCIENNVDPSELAENFTPLKTSYDLTDPKSAGFIVRDFNRLGVQKLGWIIIDTLSRNMSGNENAAEIVGAVIKSADALKRHFGCHVSVIHHTTKVGESARGSGALLGAADTELFFKKTKDIVSRTTREMKEAADGGNQQWRLTTHTFGKNPRGKDVTAIVAQAIKEAAPPVEEEAAYLVGVTPHQKDVWNYMINRLEDAFDSVSQTEATTEILLRPYWLNVDIKSSDKKRQTIRNALNALTKKINGRPALLDNQDNVYSIRPEIVAQRREADGRRFAPPEKDATIPNSGIEKSQ